VNGASTATGITVTPSITVATVKPDFTQMGIVEGPLVTETGAIIAVVTAVILLLEYFFKARNHH
jgi:F0F1-type ATP synthase membrane subunit c/vacuolar-type H+-ATPase subunit K